MNQDVLYDSELISFSRKTNLFPDNDFFNLHIHDDYELYCFISGDAYFVIEGNRYPLTPGCIVIIRPSEFHRVYVSSSVPYERFVVQFSKKLINSFDRDGTLLIPYHDRPLGRDNLYPPSKFNGILPIDLLNTAAEKENDTAVVRIKVISSLIMLLSRILVAFRDSQGNSAELLTPERIIDYISRNLNSDLSLSTLSGKFFMSESQLSRIVKQATGHSVGEYISIKRLHCAKSLLSAGEPAGNVYLNCGFRDYSTFFRAYKSSSEQIRRAIWGGRTGNTIQIIRIPFRTGCRNGILGCILFS